MIDRPAALGNYSVGRRKPIDTVVIHTMEGTAKGTAAWFANPEAHASAHYGVDVEGVVYRYVYEQDTAWHAGNPDVNARSVGIELEGHMDDRDAFTEPMLRAAARVTAAVLYARGQPADRTHVIGHNEVPDPRHPGQVGGASHHKDPGPHFPWPHFLALVREALEAMGVPAA